MKSNAKDNRVNEDEPDIRYPDVETPVFKSTIPDHLLVNATAHERHTLNALNCREQETVWAIAQLMDDRRIIRDLDRRISPMEKIVRALNSWWGLLALIAAAIPWAVSILKLIGLIK